MMAADIVITVPMGTRPNGHGFLADIAVSGTLCLSFQEKLSRLLLEPTNPQHRSIKCGYLLDRSLIIVWGLSDLLHSRHCVLGKA